MKKPGDKRGGLQGDLRRPRSFHTRQTTGIRSYRDIWLENLISEISRACDLFWTRTPERRAKAAHRKAAGFIGRTRLKNLPPQEP